MTFRKQLFSAAEIAAGVRRLADGICREFGADFEDAAVVGIHHQGVPLARLICGELKKEYGKAPLFGELDITMYRDDIGSRRLLPMIKETNIPFDVNDRTIILVDDVLSSGRTIRAALDALNDYGRPGLIRLAVMVDRGEPEYPIRADYTGMCVQLPPERKVVVRFAADSEYDEGIYEIDWK